MKKKLFIFSLMTLIFLTTIPVEGKDDDKNRGGGRGSDRVRSGGSTRSSDRARGSSGGRRSTSGGERSIQRSPSMNRSSQPSTINRPNISRPQVDRSRPSRPQSEGRTQTRNQVQQFMKNNTPSRRHHGDRGRDQGTRDGRFRNEGKHVRNQVNSHYHNRNNWFNKNFWDRHHYRPSYYNYNDNWWVPATTVGISTWLGWQNQPYYYDSYDEFGYATYPSDYYYADDYYIQPDYSQTQVIDTATFSNEWMPLGVFTIATNGRSVTTPSMFIQLAIKKNGEIAGTYYNAILDQNYALEGMVNPETQLAAWKISNNLESPVFQTGIYNLSQEEVPIRVYFQNSTTQDWLLIRIED